MKSILLKSVFFFFIGFQIQAQELLPFVENYNKSDYQGDNQIWNVAQGKDKAMYFANNHYLLRYDGVVWEKYSLPNKTIIRSILIEGDRIYSGSYKEFGYWYRENGKMHYVSITKNLRLFDEKDNEEIWKIFRFNGSLYFQSFNDVFIYNGKHIKKIKFPFLISYCFVVDNNVYVASVDKGLFKMDGSKISNPKGWDILKNTVVHAIEKYKNQTYIFTQKKGIYLVEKNGLKPWDNPLNETFKSNGINVAKFIKNNKLVVGTGNKGVFIYDFNTNTFKNIDRNNVLMNNSVLSIGFDKEEDLWLGLDNGIAHVEINSPISFFYDNSGILGSVYSVATIDKGYLIASNHGIFEFDSGNFKMMPGTQGQGWNITKIGEKYIIGHNDGTFCYEKGALTKINNISGGWNLSKSMINETYFQSTYSGVLVYNDVSKLTQSIKINDLSKPIKYVAQNKKNEIWAADNYRGLYRVLFDDNFKTQKVENITQQSKIANDFGVKIFEFRDEILFLINNVWYTFNSISNKLEENELFNTNFKNITDVVAIDKDHFIVLQEGILYHIYSHDNKFVWNMIQEKYYKGKLINENLRIFRSHNHYLMNLDDGFISLQLGYENKQNKGVKVEAYNEKELLPNEGKIKHNTELRVNVISGIYGASKPNLFYQINKGKNYIPISNGAIVLNNLSSGSHSIVIFKNDGANYDKVSSFDFKVAQPWYFSFWMIFLYLLVIGAVLFFYYKWNKLRYTQKLKLQAEELKHQREILEMELKKENELNIQEYEKHILELELQSKSSEVAGKSLSIAKQSEMIENIQNILDSEKDFNKLKSEIKKAIKINEVNKHEWEIFETNLNQIHNEFIINLSKKYPQLTPKDIKLCVYLKMNLSSKEIAPMMNISFRGVELHRYRLRKKLNLTQDENLSKFLLTL
ncbi:helix-turn-helix and ligand-binding sensor domain-containing protein [Flavobacterium johnsoniae]|uniref:helix-turn-helix and ligand-binding sensor domain-containing protein n=1 Tax=Flavobacterium johnsoniae TaxID=986 RepID=UPI0002E79864|nr:histidine kinase [Flavobacterium johnsoniae]OXE99941.1 histidine kinase [Flavobacterium johnsoniae UW101]WQG82292.1 histidine kinase [Flavobacterium johnsoniae UW101]SHK78850.1 regulatory protein, luxR family [Flavobacterium johnsoniae]